MINVEREVTATHAEFMHGLRLAFPHGMSESAEGLSVGEGGVALRIALAELPPLRIGSLALARLKVGVRGTAGSVADQLALLARMDRAMQRGGG